MRRYRAWGLNIDSELEIPGAASLERNDAIAADIRITTGNVVTGVAERVNGHYVLCGDQLLFSAPGVGQYLGTRGNTLTVAPANGADAEMVIALLIATAIPMLLWMRAELVLHAGCVVMPGCPGAIAIAGPSGAGKSTVVDQLVRAGAHLVADDSLRIRATASHMEVSGLPASYFLRNADCEARTTIVVPPSRQLDHARLAALVVVDPSEARRDADFERLSGAAAIEALLRNRHRPQIPVILGQQKRVFEDSVVLCSKVPIYSWRRCSQSMPSQWAEFAASIPASRTLLDNPVEATNGRSCEQQLKEAN